MPIQVIREPDDMQRIALELKRQGRTIGVVPTMGALHEGHLSLMRAIRDRVDVLVTTIFVNPTQFGPNEDLTAYPRTFEGDRAACEREKGDFIFFPTDQAMYPDGYRTWVTVDEMSERLCGRSRPGHFRGVTTVVTKLFQIVQPDVAAFGWKDAQQLLIIRRMTRDLNMPVEIVGVETSREPDGLARSSRNQYLTVEERKEAPALRRALLEAEDMIRTENVLDSARVADRIRRRIEEESSGEIDYIEVVSMESVQPIETIRFGDTLIALAVRFGRARLLDNIRL